LEAIVHPSVRQNVHDWLAQIPNGNAHTPHIVVIDAIKLIENGWPAVCDEVWVVTCRRETQIERLMQTRNMSRADAIMRIDAQSPQATKIAAADVVISNDGILADTQQFVAKPCPVIPRSTYGFSPLLFNCRSNTYHTKPNFSTQNGSPD
jgi:dephospho-CoA kinase